MIESAPDRISSVPKRTRRRLLLAAGAYLVLLGIAILLGNRWADLQARGQGQRLAQSTAAARASLLVSELQKYRLIPVVLGEYPAVREALRDPGGDAVRQLNIKLEGLARAIGSSAVYLLDDKGRAIAASNWRSSASFVGQDYSFRPYFTEARKAGAAEFFGLGTVSHQPGLFLSRRVGDGVIVVKFGFDAVEAGWRNQPDIVYVAASDGIVLITNHKDWRYGTTRPLSPGEAAAIRSARQFDAIAPFPLPIRTAEHGILAWGSGGLRDRLYASASIPVPVEGWMLTDLQPLAPIRAAYLGSARLAIATFAVGLMLFLALGLWIRERADYAAETRQELERRVLERTEDLEKAQAHFRSAREELAHANRLGSIGQITAAVAHEINQPVGAIRAFAENAAEFFRRGDSATGAANLAQIVALTDRIGRITAELRNYARRGSGGVSAVALDTAIEGALMLTGHVLRQHGVSIRRDGQAGLHVRADRIRLEQILVNLIQNAIEAMGQVDNAEIRLAVSSASPMALIVIADNGPGVAADVADMVFAAFTTTKPNGLGLGLGIARDIAREFGGDLDLVEGSGGGAHFHLALRLA